MSFLDNDGRRAELNALVVFVDRPRRLGAIVADAGRSLHAVRVQLISLVAVGRLTHPVHGFFAPAGFDGQVVRQPKEHRASSKGAHLATQLLALVDAPTAVRDLAVRIDKPLQTLHRLVNRLIDQGHLCRPVLGVIAPAGFDLERCGLAEKVGDLPSVGLAITACLTQPRRSSEISARLGLDVETIRRHLRGMIRAGQIVRLGYALYGLPDALSPTAMAGGPVRTQPIRDAILAYVSEPRRACEVAAHIVRPIATATGHLTAMKRLGLVVKVERGVYVRVDRDQAALKQHQLDIAA